jgi:hypothetical protein
MVSGGRAPSAVMSPASLAWHQSPHKPHPGGAYISTRREQWVEDEKPRSLYGYTYNPTKYIAQDHGHVYYLES